jgi:predicted nucleic acid-binding protein
MGILHEGTLALILFAKHHGIILAARPLVRLLRQQGMFLSDQIMNQALAQVGQ